MPIFGDNTQGSTTFPCADGRALVTKFTLSEAGDVTTLTVYCATRSGAGTSWKGVILSDSSGPSTVLGVTAASTVDATGWVTLTFSSPVSLAAGDYFLGIVANSFECEVQLDDTMAAV